MTLLQRYFRRQVLIPLLVTLSALTLLALLTQSLSTLDLIVENRQSALTFLFITVLTLPQLVSIILPLAVFMAVLYAYNRLNSDSELVVTKASGMTPWQIASPAFRVATFALILHLVVNLYFQPLSFQKMREKVFEVRTDIASQIIQAGEFISPVTGLTVYASEVTAEGRMKNVLIYDERNIKTPLTYIAREAYLFRKDNQARLVLLKASYQDLQEDKTIRILEVDRDSIDLSDILAVDSVIRLKPSDRFLHELLFPDQRQYSNMKQKDELKAEGHARLSAPLYNWALAFLAMCFMISGRHQRMGYGKQIASCVALGFGIRLLGFALTSASESTPMLNFVQYGFPIGVCFICWVVLNRRIFAKPKNTLSFSQDGIV